MNQEIKARVYNVIAKAQNIAEDQIQLDQKIEDICPHSLDLVTLLFEFEDEFNIEISDEEAKELKSVHDIVVGVEKLLEKQKTDAAELVS